MRYKEYTTVVEITTNQISKPRREQLTLTTPRNINPDGTVALGDEHLAWDLDKKNQAGE